MASGCVARLSRATASGRAGSATGDSDRRAGKAVADLAFLCPDGQRSVGVWIEERELFSSQSSSTPSEIRSSLVVAALVGPTEVHPTGDSDQFAGRICGSGVWVPAKPAVCATCTKSMRHLDGSRRSSRHLTQRNAHESLEAVTQP